MTSIILAIALEAALVAGFVQTDPSKVTIIDTGAPAYISHTEFPDEEIGFGAGGILNFHYFPGIKYYQLGRYNQANGELNYFVSRPTYTNGNPKQAQYLSTAHYVRGMIFLHHATGLGRLSLARQQFEAAIKWNGKNYAAYVELSRVFSGAGLKDQAASVLRVLLDLQPDDEKVAEDARRELNTMTTTPQVDTVPSTDGESTDTPQ